MIIKSLRWLLPCLILAGAYGGYTAIASTGPETSEEEVKNTSICTGTIRPDGHQICGTCNCQRMNPMGFSRFDNLNKLALSKFQDALEMYKEDVNLDPAAWPPKFGWEEFRMKRFLVSNGGKDAEQFGEHVDVTSHAGGKRMLIMMVYLNDDFGGGVIPAAPVTNGLA